METVRTSQEKSAPASGECLPPSAGCLLCTVESPGAPSDALLTEASTGKKNHRHKQMSRALTYMNCLM